MRPLITINQIAAAAAVSRGILSNVINGNSSVRERLRQRVLDAIQKLGSQPNQLSRGLRLNRGEVYRKSSNWLESFVAEGRRALQAQPPRPFAKSSPSKFAHQAQLV